MGITYGNCLCPYMEKFKNWQFYIRVQNKKIFLTYKIPRSGNYFKKNFFFQQASIN